MNDETPKAEPLDNEQVRKFFDEVTSLARTLEGATYTLREVNKHTRTLLEQIARLDAATAAGNVAEFVSALSYLRALGRGIEEQTQGWVR